MKSRLSALVHSETVIINDAKSCYEAAKEHLESEWPDKSECMHYMMSVQFTPRIPKCPNTKKWSGVKDTREDMHSIMNTGKRLIVNVRLITCLCPGCLHGDSECKKAECVDSWRGFDMHKYNKIDAYLNLWKSVKIHKNVSCREDYNWENVWDVLANMNTFEELAEYKLEELEEPIAFPRFPHK